jgi:membrane associated rhomboid family serine protease
LTPVVRFLVFANIAAFFLQNTQPMVTGTFALMPQLVLLRPWTLVTYMFLHGGIMHLVFNMLALFFFGPRVEERLGSRSFAWLYFLSGISGAVLSLAFTPTAWIVGASGAVFGVGLAFAWFWPDAPIYIWGVIPVPARILVIITTVLALWSGITGAGRGVAHFAHLGGYGGAFLYLKWLERKRGEFRRKVTAAPSAVTDRVEKWQAIDRAKVHEVNRAEVNRILDKISAQGLGSLTAQERIFLSNFVPPDERVPPVS